MNTFPTIYPSTGRLSHPVRTKMAATTMIAIMVIFFMLRIAFKLWFTNHK